MTDAQIRNLLNAWTRGELSVNRVVEQGERQCCGRFDRLSLQQRSEVKRSICWFIQHRRPGDHKSDHMTTLSDGATLTLNWTIPPRGHLEVFNAVGWDVEKIYREKFEEIDGMLIPDPACPDDWFQAAGKVIVPDNDNSFLRGLA
jgi:hypothetical protein